MGNNVDTRFCLIVKNAQCSESFSLNITFLPTIVCLLEKNYIWEILKNLENLNPIHLGNLFFL